MTDAKRSMREPEFWLVVHFPGEKEWRTIGLADVLSDGRGAIIYGSREEAEAAAGNDEVEMAAARRSVG
jgi:hypothetical protein